MTNSRRCIWKNTPFDNDTIARRIMTPSRRREMTEFTGMFTMVVGISLIEKSAKGMKSDRAGHDAQHSIVL